MTVALDPPTNAASRGTCGVRRRQGPDGATCKRQAGWGTNHLGHGPCRIHGGTIPNVVKHYEAVILEEQAKKLFGQLVDTTPVTNPYEALLEAATESRSFLVVLRAKIAELEEPGYKGLTGEQIYAAVQLYERALDRYANFAGILARLNIDARLAAITEQQGRIVLGAIQAALASAGVSGARAIEAGRVAAAKMRVLEAEAAGVNEEDRRGTT